MKEEITISELARLMQVSVHQVRYFEEKGVLDPAYTDENQYRMYGLDQVYQLAGILLLRKLGVSVPAIKEYLASFTPVQYKSGLDYQVRQRPALRLTRWLELGRGQEPTAATLARSSPPVCAVHSRRRPDQCLS